MTKKHIEIYAHRGGAGLMPETTLPAYENALKLGVDVLDMDVGVTKDDIVVAYHDLYLNPDYTHNPDGSDLTSHKLAVHNYTFAELQQYDVGVLNKDSKYGKRFPDQKAVPGARIPSVKQVMDLGKKIAGDKIRFQIEIKTDPRYPQATVSPEKFAQLVAQLIDEENAYEYVEVHSFDWRNLLALQKIDARIITSYISSKAENLQHKISSPETYLQWFAGHNVQDYANSWPQLINNLGGKIWCPDYKDVNTKNVTEAHEYRLRVVPWTVDDVKDMQRMIKAGVDGIITNRPDILKQVLGLL